MPKVIMVNEIEPKPGVKPEEFERFVIEELSKGPLLSGEHVAVFKVDRGERTGKYAMHVTLESVTCAPGIGRVLACPRQNLTAGGQNMGRFGTGSSRCAMRATLLTRSS